MMNRFWIFREKENEIIPQNKKVSEAFPFLEDNKKHVISIVGAGGKTTLLYAMATFLSQHNRKVLVTTSTHIMKPDKTHYAKDVSMVYSLWKKQKFAVIGVETANNKLQIQPEVSMFLDNGDKMGSCINDSHGWNQILHEADMVLIEADGSKRLPCKAPAEHEPVIMEKSDIVMDVVGLSAVNQAVKDCCCRLEQVKTLLQVSKKHLLQPQDIAKLVSSTEGGRKNVGNRDYYIVLNQCDSEMELTYAQAVVKELPEELLHNCVATAFDKQSVTV